MELNGERLIPAPVNTTWAALIAGAALLLAAIYYLFFGR
jgi:hypothetical protein